MNKGLFVVLVLCACGGKSTTPSNEPMGKMDSMMMSNKTMPVDEASKFGPLDVGADWQSYTKVNKASFKSETHGGRMVDTYVNNIGLDAFKKGEAMPAGSIIVKTSKDADDGSEGPVKPVPTDASPRVPPVNSTLATCVRLFWLGCSRARPGRGSLYAWRTSTARGCVPEWRRHSSPISGPSDSTGTAPWHASRGAWNCTRRP